MTKIAVITENQQTIPQDSLHVPNGLIIRVRAKIKETFNWVIYDIWAKQALRIPSKVSDARKQERRALIPIDEIGVENEDENADEFDQASFDNRERFWPNYDMCDKKFRRDARGCEDWV
ncbi:hypothetical protein POPTR_017G065550v4 [Populus trichocarpa]|uniref:Uncharacterized protein n=1 Tax=Populus trichocarpa TaxID=3694 RepID=A0ACC0RQ92_POPTR|nr:hypothetical protein BDE02_17G056100 [Populus trichocarpa]KAI9379249.1 hypothetical protein POPTR_017G065550v4 [Populus trichocarpa]